MEPIGRMISTSRPLSSRTSRIAVSSTVSPGSGVPFGNTHVRSLSRPAMTTSSPSPESRSTTPPAAMASRTRDARRARVVGMEGPPRIAAEDRASAARALKEADFVDDEREVAVEELGRPAAEHHARQEDLEVLHDRSDLGVDLQLQGDELLFSTHLYFGGGRRVVHAVVDVERRRLRVPHPAAMHVALVRDDD